MTTIRSTIETAGAAIDISAAPAGVTIALVLHDGQTVITLTREEARRVAERLHAALVAPCDKGPEFNIRVGLRRPEGR